MKAKQVIFFTFRADNCIDLITNSSSELFILKGETQQIVDEMIREVYPNYENEYALKSLKELTLSELGTYLSYAFETYSYNENKYVPHGFGNISADDLWIKKRSGTYEFTTLNDDFVEENLDKIRQELDPGNSMYFLWSLDENPNYEMQEQLDTIGQRYHLG